MEENKLIDSFNLDGPSVEDLAAIYGSAYAYAANKNKQQKQADCYYCGETYPSKSMTRRGIWEEVSRTNGAFTYRVNQSNWRGLSNKKSNRTGGGISYNQGRTRYKKVVVNICETCLIREEESEALTRKMWYTAAGVIGTAMIYFIYLEPWFNSL